MRIEHIGKSTVKVTVSGSELERLGLRYEDLGENILSDIFLSEMIEKACPELKNRTPPEGELSIEVFPAKDTGCVFYISPKKRRSSENIRAIITAGGIKELFGICRSLTRMGVMSENSLLTGEKHCLRLVADIPKSAALPEGSVTLADDISLACIKEHGRVIIPHNALNTLLSLNFSA